MTTLATPRPDYGSMTAHELTAYVQARSEAYIANVILSQTKRNDALLAALRALVEDTVLGRPPTQWCNVCEVSNGHTMDCSAGAGVVLLRDLSPKEEGQ